MKDERDGTSEIEWTDEALAHFDNIRVALQRAANESLRLVRSAGVYADALASLDALQAAHSCRPQLEASFSGSVKAELA